jgi:GNAT superfamily N-acetyltransferase
VSRGFVHATEANHSQLTLVGGGTVVQLDPSGKVVLSGTDPLFIYNWAFGIRLGVDLAGATEAFRSAGRPYVHICASPSSRGDLGDVLPGLGFKHFERQSYRRTTGTGAGAPGLLPYAREEAGAFVDFVLTGWGLDPATDDRRAAYLRRFDDPRTRAFRNADGSGCLLLFDDGPTTQLCHLAVHPDARGAGVGRRLLELAAGLIPAGRPLWLFTELDGPGDRTAAAAGWARNHTADNWLLDLEPELGSGSGSATGTEPESSHGA